VGTDISPGMVRRVMERGCDNYAYVANANESLAPTSKERSANLYDLVTCTGAMELLDQARVLTNLAKITNASGEIFECRSSWPRQTIAPEY
jgi:predicted TPR repeat methyltransferase